MTHTVESTNSLSGMGIIVSRKYSAKQYTIWHRTYDSMSDTIHYTGTLSYIPYYATHTMVSTILYSILIEVCFVLTSQTPQNLGARLFNKDLQNIGNF